MFKLCILKAKWNRKVNQFSVCNAWLLLCDSRALFLSNCFHICICFNMQQRNTLNAICVFTCDSIQFCSQFEVHSLVFCENNSTLYCVMMRYARTDRTFTWLMIYEIIEVRGVLLNRENMFHWDKQCKQFFIIFNHFFSLCLLYLFVYSRLMNKLSKQSF